MGKEKFKARLQPIRKYWITEANTKMLILDSYGSALQSTGGAFISVNKVSLEFDIGHKAGQQVWTQVVCDWLIAQLPEKTANQCQFVKTRCPTWNGHFWANGPTFIYMQYLPPGRETDRDAARPQLQVEEADAVRHQQGVAPHGRRDDGPVHVPHQGTHKMDEHLGTNPLSFHYAVSRIS